MPLRLLALLFAAGTAVESAMWGWRSGGVVTVGLHRQQQRHYRPVTSVTETAVATVTCSRHDERR